MAVLFVVIYHLWPNRLPGGFVGVDVFFGISGFLITGHLLRELQSTGRIRVGSFWGRRVRRLLPASLLVLLVTAAAVLVFVPRAFWAQFEKPSSLPSSTARTGCSRSPAGGLLRGRREGRERVRSHE